MPEELKPYEFEKGKSGNPNGRPKGVRNRSTIIRELLELNDQELKMHQAQIDKTIDSADTNAYKAVLDSAYGAPTQHNSIDANITSEDVTPIMFTKTKPIDKAE